MDKKAVHRVHGVTALIAFAAIVFYLFFLVNKGGPFRAINPFNEDPYDAVGSIAFQLALVAGALAYARALRVYDAPAQVEKTALILRGNLLVLFAVWITLLTDAVAVIVRPVPPSFWGTVLLAELALMFLFALTCTVVLLMIFRRIQIPAPPRDLTPADAIDDLWTLVRVPVTKARAGLPPAFVAWVGRINSDWFFARISWLSARTHPWRFACALGLLAGVGLALAHLQEGLPPSLTDGLLLTAIIIAVEFGATIFGFALFGGYLGLRPSWNNSD